MIEITNLEVCGEETALRGMRNSYDSHKLSTPEKDMKLACALVKEGTASAKFLRFITVSFDIKAPLYWWKQADTYKYMEKNSESTMHTIMKRPLTIKDFDVEGTSIEHDEILLDLIAFFNRRMDDYRQEMKHRKSDSYSMFNEEMAKECFNDIIHLLPSSFMQMRTVTTNYQELLNMYLQREGHKLSEWKQFNVYVETLPMMKEFIAAAKKSNCKCSCHGDGNVSDNHS